MSSIVLFDGVCNFCNEAVNFIIRHDGGKKFTFAPLQSDVGRGYRQEFGIGDDVDSIILIEDGRPFMHSTAGLRIASGLGGMWSLAYVLVIIPRPLRDLAYKMFANYRYRLFGKKDMCMMPTSEISERFVG